jgi:hypothetical protein
MAFTSTTEKKEKRKEKEKKKDLITRNWRAVAWG